MFEDHEFREVASALGVFQQEHHVTSMHVDDVLTVGAAESCRVVQDKLKLI